MEQEKTNITAVNRVNKCRKIAHLETQGKVEFLKQVEQILNETNEIFQKALNPTPALLAELLNSDVATIREIYLDLITIKIDNNE